MSSFATLLRPLALRSVALALALVAAGSSRAFAAGPIEVGVNQAWLPGGFGTDLTSTFDESAWKQALERTRDAGGSILRVWLFEGQPGQGVLWDETDPHKPAGVDAKLLENVKRLAQLAAEQHVRIYWTARDGNWPNYADKSKQVDTDRLWNVDSDKYGFGKLWDEKVLGPVVDAIGEKPEALYGLDLMNESEGMVSAHAWADGWTGARAYLTREAAFVHARAPGVKVSASAGWGSAAKDILEGHFDGLGLDFLDVHVYSDSGKIPEGDKLVAHARKQGVPILVGEFGQDSKAVDPALQARVARGVLEDAARLGFSAVLAWQLADDDKHLTLYDGETARPVVAVLREFAAAHAPAPTANPAPPAVSEPAASPAPPVVSEPAAPTPAPTPAAPAPVSPRCGIASAVDAAAAAQAPLKVETGSVPGANEGDVP